MYRNCTNWLSNTFFINYVVFVLDSIFLLSNTILCWTTCNFVVQHIFMLANITLQCKCAVQHVHMKHTIGLQNQLTFQTHLIVIRFMYTSNIICPNLKILCHLLRSTCINWYYMDLRRMDIVLYYTIQYTLYVIVIISRSLSYEPHCFVDCYLSYV